MIRPATLLLAVAPIAATADATITLSSQAGDTQYTVTHWQTGQSYSYTVTAGEDRTVSVPRGSGDLLVYDDEARHVDTVDAGTQQGEPTRYVAEPVDLQPVESRLDGHGDTLDAHAATAEAHTGRLGKHTATLDTHGARIDGHASALATHGERLGSHADRLNTHTDLIAATAAMTQLPASGPGLTVSAGAALRGQAVAVQYAVGRLRARAVYAAAGRESIAGAGVSVRLW